MNRIQRLQQLKMYFLTNLVEDPIDGTAFDLAVMEHIKKLERMFSECVCNTYTLENYGCSCGADNPDREKK